MHGLVPPVGWGRFARVLRFVGIVVVLAGKWVDIFAAGADNSIEPCRSRRPKYHLGHAERHSEHGVIFLSVLGRFGVRWAQTSSGGRDDEG